MTTEPAPIWEQLGPGLHRGITDHQYHVECNTLASQSVLKPLTNGKSPAHVRERLLNPDPPSAAMLLGTAFHAAVLEPHAYHEKVLVGPTADRRSKAWKEAEEALPKGMVLITPDESMQIVEMSIAVLGLSKVRLLIEEAQTSREAYVEAMGLWRTIGANEQEDGGPEAPEPLQPDTPFPVWCKFRPDLFLPERGIVLDLKTTLNAERREFERSIYNFGYHLQAGFYFEGLRRLGFSPEYYLIVAIEKDPPYGVRVYNLEPEVIDYGWEMMREPLRVFSQCTASGVWPGWADKAEDIGLPPWAMKEASAFMELT